VITEIIKVVAHRMAGAYAKGLIQAIANAIKHPDECRELKITEFYLASFQQNDPSNKAVIGTSLKQYENAQKRVRNHGSGKGHSIFYFWNQINTHPEGTYVFQNEKFIKTK
jgi:hypothetical protein